MRSLGYHRLISVENFRTPNFGLVAEILDWLLHRFEPNCGISDDISTEAARVQFIKSVCERVLLRTGTKLNTRKLYGADGYAVKELLKLAQVLYDAQKSVNEKGDFNSDESFGLSSKLSDLKSTRSLCSQIVETGAGLFDLLQKEGETRQDREKALRFLDGMSRNLESNSEHEVVERAVMSMLGNHGQNLEQLKQMSEELQRDEKSLEQKIKKKRQELERCKKRLTSLVNVRPAFMDEYEQLEQQFERYYEQYVGRFRNLDYLEHSLDALNREEKERMEENERALKRMQKRLRDEEWRLLRGEEDEKDGEKRKPKKGAGAKSWMPPAAVGSMDGGEETLSEAESGSDSDPRISIGGSSHASEDPPVSLGGSASDDDILNESEEDDDLSDGGGNLGGGMRGGNDFDF
jgi:clusterin-associated protein 1